jgi:hypothetical protein
MRDQHVPRSNPAAFRQKLKNFEAAVALNFAYYNFCKLHGAIRFTPAVAAGEHANVA